jgi:hypothetical protein
MPWQRYVADVGCELDPATGLPAYREIIVTVPRQSGKTELFLSWQIDRSLNWGRAQRSVFTAQSGKDARDKWVDELFPLIRSSELSKLVRQINEGKGDESITWKKPRSRIRLLSTSTSSGHAKTLDQAVIDELWHDEDDRREQGLRPAMVTRPDAQLLVCSTAGTRASVVLNSKRRTGRTATQDDSGFGVAYFEWSAPDNWDPANEESWFAFMPALCPDPPCRCGEGWRHTISLEVIRSERAAMKPEEFLRAYGNRTTQTEDELIPVDRWQMVSDPQASPQGQVRFALDVSEDRSSASIAACAGDVVELIDHHQGTFWVATRCNSLVAKHGAKIRLDGSGPAGSFASAIDAVDELAGREALEADGQMYDAIMDGSVKFRAHPDFDAAVAGVSKKQSGDLWGFSRRSSSADITPLKAASLAFAASEPAMLVTF